tara:strand:- start:37 stop:249 length:213 start_codon:yes stop_codon:yes gene_type:complete
MKRIEKVGELLVKGFTYPIRLSVGIIKCTDKVIKCVRENTPKTLDGCMPFEIKSKRKEETNGSTETNDAR